MAATTPGTWTLDPHSTVIAFHLSGALHDTHGTFTLRQGSLQLDPVSGAASGSIIVDAASGASGNSARDARMTDEVLEAARYPDIRFQPSHVDVRQEADGSFQATIHGVLSLHGVDHDIKVDATGHLLDDEITAHCHFVVPYVEWGLTDPSVFLLSVAKQVDIEFATMGRVAWNPRTKETE